MQPTDRCMTYAWKCPEQLEREVMEFNKAVLTTIDNTLRSGKSQVRLSGTWKKLHDQFGVGRRVGATQNLSLAPSDIVLLRELVRKHTQVDLLDLDGGYTLSSLQQADRLETARHLPNEKLSGVSVARDIVLIGSATGRLDLPSEQYQIPTGAALSCHFSCLNGLDQVVLIENLAVMYALDRYEWPESVVDRVMLFRGSPQHSPKAVSNAIMGVGEVIAFPDYDPQGLMNSFLQTKATGMIIPSMLTVDQLVSRGMNKTPEYQKQEVARQWLASKRIDDECVKRMLDQKLALSQESMLGYELGVLRWTQPSTC